MNNTTATQELFDDFEGTWTGEERRGQASTQTSKIFLSTDRVETIYLPM